MSKKNQRAARGGVAFSFGPAGAKKAGKAPTRNNGGKKYGRGGI